MLIFALLSITLHVKFSFSCGRKQRICFTSQCPLTKGKHLCQYHTWTHCGTTMRKCSLAIIPTTHLATQPSLAQSTPASQSGKLVPMAPKTEVVLRCFVLGKPNILVMAFSHCISMCPFPDYTVNSFEGLTLVFDDEQTY